MTNIQDRLPGTLSQPAIEIGNATPGDAPPMDRALPAALRSGDRINRMAPPAQLTGTGADPLGGVIQSLLGAIEQLLSMLGMNGSAAAQPSQQYFQSADASSSGDPHLAFTGSPTGGGSVHTKFDSMTSHPDLLNSSSFEGGFRIATQTTQPGANGVTYNRSACVSTGGGRTRVELENTGSAFVEENGGRYALNDGQSYALGNGESVARAADGSVQIAMANGQGGSILTTLTTDGRGVDVRTHAQDVALGGDLLTQPG